MDVQILHSLEESEAREVDFAALNRFSKSQSYHYRLRDYQQKQKESIYNEWGSGKMNVMLQMPTGTGKTHLFSSIIKDLQDYYFNILQTRTSLTYVERQKYAIPKILVLVHRKELVDQIRDTLVERYHHVCGVVMGGVIYGENKNVIVATTQTMGRKKRLEKWERSVCFDFIIIDEAHHSTADSYRRIREAWPNARLLGVTATPYRLNHQPFTDVYDKLILSEPVYRFIEKGYLCQYDYCSIKPNSQIQDKINHLATDFSGDYDEQAMENLLNQDRIRASILGTYEKFAKGKKGIVYTINRLHNQMLAELFESHGYKVAYIDSLTPKEERNQTVEAFKRGEIEIIFNVNIFSEGFDCPDVEFIQLARPTKSLSMYLQQVGRGFRIAKGKEKVIFLDNVGLYNRFGLPSARRAWQHHFEGREDWEDEKGGENGSLGEPHDTGADLSEGNEDVSIIYTSISQQQEEKHTQTETEVVETIDLTEPSQNTEQQETNTNMDNETIIVCKNQKYVVEELSQKELAEMLLLIEDVCKTGMIDVEALKRTIESLDEERRRAMEQFIANSGYSKEELMAFLSSQEQSQQSEERKVEAIRSGLYVKMGGSRIIQCDNSTDTFVNAIELIGVEKVYNLHILVLGKYLVNHEKDDRYTTRKIGGYYIITHSDTRTKKRQLESICNLLGLHWEIGISNEELNSKEFETSLQSGLYIVTKDGVFIQESTGSKTLLKALLRIGYEQVYEACWARFWNNDKAIMQGLISTKPQKRYEERSGQHIVEENGAKYYIITNTNTQTKKRQLQNLSNALNLSWTVEIEGGEK